MTMVSAETREARAEENLVKYPPGELTKYGKPRMNREEAEDCLRRIREGLAANGGRWTPQVQRTGKPTGRHQVYRFYDAEGLLLYVGLSVSLLQRMGQHRNSQGWWQQVQRVEIEHVPSREAAAEREKHLIATLAPLYNRNGGGA